MSYTDSVIARIDHDLALEELARLSPQDRAAVRQYVADVAAAAAACTDCEWVDVRRLCDPAPTRFLALPCPRHQTP